MAKHHQNASSRPSCLFGTSNPGSEIIAEGTVPWLPRESLTRIDEFLEVSPYRRGWLEERPLKKDKNRLKQLIDHVHLA